MLGSPFESMRAGIGFLPARDVLASSGHAVALAPLLDALAAQPGVRWPPRRAACFAGFAEAAPLEAFLVATLGFGFAELLDRARLDRALQRLHGNGVSVDAIAQEYHDPRPHAPGEARACACEDLDLALVRLLGIDLDGVVTALRRP